MCGITGIYAFNMVGGLSMINLAKATEALSSRGPDNQGHYNDEVVGLGHRRLSVIDTSADANQPMKDETGRFNIIFNGEIYNFKSLRQELEATGVNFRTSSDTEVLLQLLIREGERALQKLNGFFAFAFYDKQTRELLIARDRFGIKPIHYLHDQDKLIFASEVKSLFEYGVERRLNQTALYTYLQLNYLPAPFSMIQGMNKLLPGHFLRIRNGKVSVEQYYDLKKQIEPFNGSYEEAKIQFRSLLEQAVVDRLVADVPLGTFLSGGTDSSVISVLAARHVKDLKTFSIGYKDEPFFDETRFANATAGKLGTEHSVFSLTNNDLFEHLHSVLNYLDEPFADSSALAVYILSRETRKEVTVALSGDGADELFAGYNKHAALQKILSGGMVQSLASSLGPIWKILPKSRNSSFSNRFRQLDRFARAAKLNAGERYWFLATLGTADYAQSLIKNRDEIDYQGFNDLKTYYLNGLDDNSGINNNLLVDQLLVLPNDMLTKVDLMSMANSLEIRVPFLDHKVVQFANSLPESMKIDNNLRKKILQDTFRNDLPEELYNRQKKGFEVPLLKWFRTELKSAITDDFLADDFIIDQGIFNVHATKKLKKALFSSSSGDTHANIWALIIFQSWYKQYFAS
jgi:asparagine synthase (glutamine-hydrolysing)